MEMHVVIYETPERYMNDINSFEWSRQTYDQYEIFTHLAIRSGWVPQDIKLDSLNRVIVLWGNPVK